MPTDGADFKRRVKYHGRTYTEIKTGTDVGTVAQFSCAGLAREILGDNPIPAFRELILATVDCHQGIFSRDPSCLLQELQTCLNDIAGREATSPAQQIVVESLIRESGRLGDFLGSWRDAAAERLPAVMRSIFETGKPDRQFTRPRPELTPIRADSMEDLTSSLT